MAQRILRDGVIQAKLTVNQPGDCFEQEADRVADQVMKMSEPGISSAAVSTNRGAAGNLQRKCACGGSTSLTGECADCRKDKLLGTNGAQLQRKLTIGASNDPLEQEADRVAEQVLTAPTHPAVSSAPPRIQRFSGQSSGQKGAAPASVDRVIASPGRPLDPMLRQDMEWRFSHDFSRVRVHSGAAAEQSVRDVNANAYTAGHNIVFGSAQFAPKTHEGRRLIAHELTHVVQQSGADGMRASRSAEKRGLSPISQGDAVEHEANRAAAHIMIGQPVAVRSTGVSGIQRQVRSRQEIQARMDEIHKQLYQNTTTTLSEETERDLLIEYTALERELEELPMARVKRDIEGTEQRLAEVEHQLSTSSTTSEMETQLWNERNSLYVEKGALKQERAQEAKANTRRHRTVRYFRKLSDHKLKAAYFKHLEYYLSDTERADWEKQYDLETLNRIVQERFPNAPWHEEARQALLEQLQRRERFPTLPWYQRQQLDALGKLTQGWPEEAQRLAEDLLWKWFEMQNAGHDHDQIKERLLNDLASQFEQVLRASDQAIQEECRKDKPSRLMKIWGDPCEPWFEYSHQRGYHDLSMFRIKLRILSAEQRAPYLIIHNWVERYVQESSLVVNSKDEAHLQVLLEHAVVANALNLSSAHLAPSFATPLPTPVAPVRGLFKGWLRDRWLAAAIRGADFADVLPPVGAGGTSARPVPALVSGRAPVSVPVGKTTPTQPVAPTRITTAAPQTLPTVSPKPTPPPVATAPLIAVVDPGLDAAFARTFDQPAPAIPPGVATTIAPEIAAGFAPGQLLAVGRLLGKALTDAGISVLARIWAAAANAGEVGTLTLANSRQLFDNHRKRFWRLVRGDAAALALFTNAGFVFGGDLTTAPFRPLADGSMMQLTIDHIIERQTAPGLALNAGNLRVVSRRENTVMLRQITEQDPFQ